MSLERLRGRMGRENRIRQAGKPHSSLQGGNHGESCVSLLRTLATMW